MNSFFLSCQLSPISGTVPSKARRKGYVCIHRLELFLSILLTLFLFLPFCSNLPLPTALPPPSSTSGDGLKFAIFLS